jgi:sugar lactone lactonase YvrE
VVVRSERRDIFLLTHLIASMNPNANSLSTACMPSILMARLLLVGTDFDRPNGLAFSPDEKTLYIGDSRRRHVRAFDVDDE